MLNVKEIVHIEPDDEQALADSVVKIGPVAVGITASCSTFIYYSSGVIRNANCPGAMDHSVTVVGLGVDEATGIPYYLVKNSWGGSWGQKGYVKIARNNNNQLNIASDASYALIV